MVNGKKTVFILFGNLGIGGIQKKIADLSGWIKEHQKNTQLIILLEWTRNFDLDKDIFLELVEKNGAKVFYKPQLYFKRFYLPYLLFVLWNTIKFKPDSVLAFMENYSLDAVLLKLLLFWRKIKIIISYDNVATLYINDAYGKKNSRKWKFVVKYLFPFSDKIVVPSNTSKSDLVRNFAIQKDKIVVNKNWVLGFEGKSKNIPIRKKYDIIYVGRIDKGKNLSYLISIASRLKIKFKKIKLALVGWGDDLDSVVGDIYAKKLENNFDFLGSVLNVQKVLDKSKIFILTSEYEGLPIAALEAMKSGLTVVTSAYPGSAELIRDGITGLICRDETEFIEKISMSLEDSRKLKLIGKNAKNYVQKYHSVKNLENFAGLL